MFFGSPAIVARVKKSYIELYFPPKNQFYKLEIPKSIVNFMDVINEETFFKYLLDFLIKINKKSANVDMVLDDDVLFEKIIPKTNDSAAKVAIDDFFSNIPLEQNTISGKTFFSNNQYYLYAASRVYFNSIVKAFAKYGWRVNYVAPLGIFGIKVQNQVLSDEDLRVIRKGNKSALGVNFMDERQADSH